MTDFEAVILCGGSIKQMNPHQDFIPIHFRHRFIPVKFSDVFKISPAYNPSAHILSSHGSPLAKTEIPEPIDKVSQI